MTRPISRAARLSCTFALAALAAAPLAAEGVGTPEQADAEFTEAMNSGIRASTRGEAKKCAGYWWALQMVHENSEGVAFWANMPGRLSLETAKLGRGYWNQWLIESYGQNSPELEQVGNEVFDYRQEAIKRIVDAEQTGGIDGFFSMLGYCVPQ